MHSVVQSCPPLKGTRTDLVWYERSESCSLMMTPLPLLLGILFVCAICQGLKTIWVEDAVSYYEPMWNWRMLMGQRRRWKNGTYAVIGNCGSLSRAPHMLMVDRWILLISGQVKLLCTPTLLSTTVSRSLP
jgi:hypothetical protein